VPTYQYACTECGHQLEAVQSFSDAALTECPNCHGKLRKVFNSVGIVFKGSGFYRNDSRSANGSADKAEKSEKSEKSATSSGSETKADAGSATPASAKSTPAAASSSSSSSGSASSTPAKSATPAS
jgi:putative FmdB family regulatory protein